MSDRIMTEQEAREIDLQIARSLEGKLCSDCPPAEFPNATTRCLPCPRRLTHSASDSGGKA